MTTVTTIDNDWRLEHAADLPALPRPMTTPGTPAPPALRVPYAYGAATAAHRLAPQRNSFGGISCPRLKNSNAPRP